MNILINHADMAYLYMHKKTYIKANK